MFFIPSLLASSNEIDDVPIPDAPPISMIRGSSDLLIFFQALYFLANNGYAIPFINYLVLFQTIIATLLVIYTLIRFIIFIMPAKNSDLVHE